MTETNTKKKRAPKQKSHAGLDDLRVWLMTLNPAIKPALHVNGREYPFCVMTVDFGTPLEPVELSADEVTELTKKLKVATKEMVAKNADDNPSIRVFNDTANGVWWAGKD